MKFNTRELFLIERALDEYILIESMSATKPEMHGGVAVFKITDLTERTQLLRELIHLAKRVKHE